MMVNQAGPQRPAAERMHCMEVWGGNRGANKSFEMAGLRAWLYSRPHGGNEHGGDVYFISSCASGRITRLLLADVSGHGPLVSKTAITLRDLMREHVNHVKQTRLVGRMNREFAGFTQQGVFATAVVGTYFAPTRSLSLCNAGHPPPLVRRRREQRWRLIHAPQRDDVISDTPLGVEEDAQYSQSDMRLGVGDLALFYSDAAIETFSPSDNAALGISGLERLVNNLGTTEPHLLFSRILESTDLADAPESSGDDLTLLLVEVTPARTRMRDNVLAPWRLLRSANDATNFEWGRPGEETQTEQATSQSQPRHLSSSAMLL